MLLMQLPGLLIAVHAGQRRAAQVLAAQLVCMPSCTGCMKKDDAGFLIVQGPADEKTAGELQAGLAGLPHCKYLKS